MSDKFQILERMDSENHSEYAYRVLKANIMNLNLEPGEVLNEPALAEDLGVSRTPVREAIFRLKEEKLVEVFPRHASRIALIDMQLLIEGYFARFCIEPEVLKAVAGNISSDMLLRLKENMDEQQMMLQSDIESYHFFKIDDEFHHMIYEFANKPLVYEAVKKIGTHFDRIRYLVTILENYELEEVYRQHQQLFQCMLFGMDGDFDIKEFYRRHLIGFQQYIPKVQYKFPQYFSYGGE